MLTGMAAGRSDRSPLVRITRARKVRVRLDAPLRYELDGGARGRTCRLKALKALKAQVVPAPITVCVPVGG
jgi:diacylglycerol kinase (ATP)